MYNIFSIVLRIIKFKVINYKHHISTLSLNGRKPGKSFSMENKSAMPFGDKLKVAWAVFSVVIAAFDMFTDWWAFQVRYTTIYTTYKVYILSD